MVCRSVHRHTFLHVPNRLCVTSVEIILFCRSSFPLNLSMCLGKGRVLKRIMELSSDPGHPRATGQQTSSRASAAVGS